MCNVGFKFMKQENDVTRFIPFEQQLKRNDLPEFHLKHCIPIKAEVKVVYFLSRVSHCCGLSRAEDH